MRIGNLTTSAKFLVIGSVFRADLTVEQNMENHVDAGYTLALAGYNRIVDVTGYYREEGQAVGSLELSRAIPVSTLRDVGELTYLFCNKYKQDCILVMNNDNEMVWLMDAEGKCVASLGHWKESLVKPDTQGWTYDGSKYYYAE